MKKEQGHGWRNLTPFKLSVMGDLSMKNHFETRVGINLASNDQRCADQSRSIRMFVHFGLETGREKFETRPVLHFSSRVGQLFLERNCFGTTSFFGTCLVSLFVGGAFKRKWSNVNPQVGGTVAECYKVLQGREKKGKTLTKTRKDYTHTHSRGNLLKTSICKCILNLPRPLSKLN